MLVVVVRQYVSRGVRRLHTYAQLPRPDQGSAPWRMCSEDWRRMHEREVMGRSSLVYIRRMFRLRVHHGVESYDSLWVCLYAYDLRRKGSARESWYSRDAQIITWSKYMKKIDMYVHMIKILIEFERKYKRRNWPMWVQ